MIYSLHDLDSFLVENAFLLILKVENLDPGVEALDLGSQGVEVAEDGVEWG